MIDISKFKEELLARGQLAREQLARLTTPNVRELASGDMYDALASHSSLETHLDDIEKALARIKEGTYGFCLMCGEEIPSERLASFPQAKRCSGCQEKKEVRRGRR